MKAAGQQIYDVPGPRARLRNRILAVATVLVVAAVLGFVAQRFQATGQFSAAKWRIFGYTAVWAQILRAMMRTLTAFALAVVLATALGFLLALGRLSDHAWVRAPARAFVEVFRAIPVLILMMLMYYGPPAAGYAGVSPFEAVVTGLTLYNGTVLAEAIRSGVESLPRGQEEAARALGLRKGQMMAEVLLPQAVRAVLPVIVSQLVVILKDTALGFIITYQELLYYAKFVGSRPEYGSPIIPATLVVGGIYVVLCLLVAACAKLVERRLSGSWKRPRREGAEGPAPAAPDLEITALRAED